MTEQPDTAKVRALGQLSMTFPELRAVVVTLCDALDAARAMRDTHAADVTDLANKHARALDRAKAAEANRDRFQALFGDEVKAHHRTQTGVHRLEARIANALRQIKSWPGITAKDRLVLVERALTKEEAP